MSEYKECPYCGEQILAKAVKCKHCQSMLTDTVPSAPAIGADVPSADDSRIGAPAAPVAGGVPAAGQAPADQGATPADTTSGLPKNVAGLLSYVLGWLTGIIFFIIEKDPFVRFHAMQSILTFGGLTCVSIVLWIVLPLGLWRLWAVFQLLNTLVWLASLVLWVLLMVKAYQGERFKLPLVGDMAERYAGQ